MIYGFETPDCSHNRRSQGDMKFKSILLHLMLKIDKIIEAKRVDEYPGTLREIV